MYIVKREVKPLLFFYTLKQGQSFFTPGKSTGTMVTTAVVHGVTLRGSGGTTMNHDQVDATVVLVLRTMQYSVSHFSNTGLQSEGGCNGG